MGYSKAQLLADLVEHNEFFDMMVDMIPSKLYISPRKLEEQEEQDGAVVSPNKYHRHASKNPETKQARRAAAKAAKRRKLDPQAVETTSTLQKKLAQGTAILPPPPKVVTPTTTDTTTKDNDKKNDTTASTNKNENSNNNDPNQSRIEALRAKLHAKIAAKQALNPRPQDPNQISKRAARRAEKERRREEAKKRKGGNANSTANDGTTNTRYTATAASSAASRAADLAQVDFGRLAGLNTPTTADALQKNYQQSNKALQNLNKSKNLHKMLADAQAKREKLEALKQGTDEDQAKAQQMQWSDTLKEADGQRIKDDPNKLKKAIKRKAAKKAKSQKAWQSRTAQVDKKLQDRQKIRQHNLQARKQGGQAGANLSRKEIRTADSNGGEDQGRRLSRAGFEGRKRDFLNGGDKKKTTAAGGAGKKNQ